MVVTSDPAASPPCPTVYFMESDDEGARLEDKTDPITTGEQLSWAGLRPGMRAVDVGCGTGAVTRVAAGIAGAGNVVGIDSSAARLEQARRLAADLGLEVVFMAGNADHLPLSDNAVDFAWSRFLFEYLPAPERALAELCRVTRPGGVIAVADLDNQLEGFWPLAPSPREELREALRLLGTTGFDPRVGRKLYSWFHNAGLQEIAVRVMPHQVYAGGLSSRDLANWRQKLRTAAACLGEIDGEVDRWQSLATELLTLLQRPDGFYYSIVVLVRATVPSAAGDEPWPSS